MKNIREYLIKSFQDILFMGLVIAWVLLQDSPLAKDNWGNYEMFSFRDALPLIVVLCFGILVAASMLVYKEVVKRAKAEQYSEDCREFIRLLRVKEQNIEQELSILKGLISNKNLTEQKINAIWKQIKDKVQLSKVHELPEFALSLIEKIVDIKDELNVVLETTVEGDLSSLKRVNPDDLNLTLDLMVETVTEQLRVIPVEERSNIFMSIREKAKQVSITVLYDYQHDQVNCELMEWKIRKLLNRYGGEFKVQHEQEDELNTLILTVDVPKEGKRRKII